MDFVDFKALIKELQEFEGVTRKNSIENVINLLSEAYNVSGEVIIVWDYDFANIRKNIVLLMCFRRIIRCILQIRRNRFSYAQCVRLNISTVLIAIDDPLPTVNTLIISWKRTIAHMQTRHTICNKRHIGIFASKENFVSLRKHQTTCHCV